ncbi:MAG: glycosyltransferase [Phycisphaerae bacterium]|nr:glycosyltransferase [Phycisphaerae bacterium]
MTRRRVFISCYFPRSVALEGVGTLVCGFSRAFTCAGWDVTLLLPQGEYAVSDATVEMYRPGLFGVAGLPRYYRAVGRLSALADVTLLVESSPALGASVSCVADLARARALFYLPLQTSSVLREIGLSRQALVHWAGMHRLWARRIDWRDKHCVVGSEFQVRQMRALHCGHVDVLPVSGVSRDATVLSRSAARRRLGWDDQPVVGYLGHYSRAKGVDVLVEAFAKVRGAGVLALAHSGRGELTSRGRAALASLRAQGRVRELGVCEPLNFLAACDVVALPYITSSICHQPQVLLESLAASTAVVTTALGGFAELLSQGPCGWVIRPRDVDALASALAGALADLPALHATGQRGRTVFEASCASERMVAYMDEIVARASRP